MKKDEKKEEKVNFSNKEYILWYLRKSALYFNVKKACILEKKVK